MVMLMKMFGGSRQVGLFVRLGESGESGLHGVQVQYHGTYMVVGTYFVL